MHHVFLVVVQASMDNNSCQWIIVVMEDVRETTELREEYFNVTGGSISWQSRHMHPKIDLLLRRLDSNERAVVPLPVVIQPMLKALLRPKRFVDTCVVGVHEQRTRDRFVAVHHRVQVLGLRLFHDEIF